MAEISEGETLTYSRTFTTEDVRTFAALSNDRGHHHVVEGDDGTLMVHGLLTATLPTKIGGDLNYVARQMDFEFHRPVYTGEEITCEVTADRVEETGERTVLDATCVCRNETDEVVLTAETSGVIFD